MSYKTHIFGKPFHEDYVSPFCDPEVLRCPECRSEDVEYPYPKDGHYLRCRKCGYVDFFYGRWLKKKDEAFSEGDHCVRCGKPLSEAEMEIDTGNLCTDCREITINAEGEGDSD